MCKSKKKNLSIFTLKRLFNRVSDIVYAIGMSRDEGRVIVLMGETKKTNRY